MFFFFSFGGRTTALQRSISLYFFLFKVFGIPFLQKGDRGVGRSTTDAPLFFLRAFSFAATKSKEKADVMKRLALWEKCSFSGGSKPPPYKVHFAFRQAISSSVTLRAPPSRVLRINTLRWGKAWVAAHFMDWRNGCVAGRPSQSALVRSR